jgi:hypothetical protein
MIKMSLDLQSVKLNDLKTAFIKALVFWGL